MFEEILGVLKAHVGENVHIRYLNGSADDVRFIDGKITDYITDTHVGIMENECVIMIPISEIELIAKDQLWWKEYKPSNVYYGSDEIISKEFEDITGFPFSSKSR